MQAAGTETAGLMPAPAAPSSAAGSAALPLYNPVGQTVTSIDTKAFETSPQFTVSDLISYSPGVTVTQGNGPRDMGISIRGSNANNLLAYAISSCSKTGSR